MKKTILVSLFIIAAFTMAIAASDGATVYNQCKPCHGNDGSKTPIGAERAIKGLKADDVSKILKGYQAGTYGGAKKATMERIAKGLSQDDITAVAGYISKF